MSVATNIRTPSAVSYSAARLWAVIVLLALAAIIAYVNRINLSIAVVDSQFKAAFHFTNSQRGLLNSAFFWSYAALQIPAGWLVDRYGTKYPLAASFIVWSGLTALTAATTGFATIFAVRLLLGVSEAAMHPASIRWIAANLPERQRGLAVGVYMSGSKLGPAVGAPLAAWLIGIYGWRSMFLLTGLLSLIWVLPWLGLIKNDAKDVAAAKLPTRGRKALVGNLWANPVLWGTIIGTFSYMYFVYFCLTWMPTYLSEARGLSLGSSSLFTGFSFAGIAIVAILGGWAADRMIAAGHDAVKIRKAFTIAGFLLAATEVFGAWLPLDWALAVSILSLSGLGLATANYWALTQTLIPGAAIGRIVGIQNCAASLPGIVAPIMTGWLVDTTGSYQAPMATVMVFLLIGVFAYLFLVQERYAPAMVAVEA